MEASFSSVLSAAKLSTRPELPVIAGPCAAESEAQLLATARELHAVGIRCLRAGVWKPRSRPNQFEGAGAGAFPWLRRVKDELGMQVAVEVANASMVEAAIEAGVDVLWVGARTSVSPFAVQEIAEALRGSRQPVLVKNPVNPDLGLWLGAIERLEACTGGGVAACHRGFSVYGRRRFRNLPYWEIPLELRRQRPELALLCDPSHIAGRRELIPELAQKALDLGMDGLMIESHADPASARSDAAQQLPPSELAELLQSLQLRQQDSDSPAFQHSLAELRAAIDEIDEELLEELARRMRIVGQIGQLKADNNVRPFQLGRWQEVFRDRRDRAAEHGLSEAFVRRFLELLHIEALHFQDRVNTSETASPKD